MKKNSLRKCLGMAGLTCAIVACDPEEKYDGPLPGEVNALYSNQLTASGEKVLQLVYNGREVTGREVYFKMTGPGCGDFVLLDVIPGERKTPVTEVKLVSCGDGYGFSGTAASTTGTGFDYQGTVYPGRLFLELSKIRIPENQLSGNAEGWWHLVHNRPQEMKEDPETGEYVFYHSAFRMEAGDEKLKRYAALINSIAGNLLTSVLKDVVFHRDGQITAAYAPLPEEFSAADIIFSPLQRPDTVWRVSPSDLVLYAVRGNRLYMLPNIDMLMKRLETRKVSVRTTESSSVGMKELQALYSLLNRWATTGVCFHIEHNSGVPEKNGGAWTCYEGNIYLHLDKKEIEALLPFFPLIKTLIPGEVMDGMLGNLIGSMFDDLAEGLYCTPYLKIGFMLNRNQSNL